MSLRVADLADLDAIMAIERASFPSDAWSAAMMRAELESEHNRYLVVEETGRIVGYGGLRAPRGAADGDIQTIALAASSRGRGAGRALLGALLEQASLRGVRHVFLEVRADNDVAQALYRSEGFAELARRPHYYQPDDVDAIVMRLDLPAWAHARMYEDRPDVGGFAADPPTSARSSDISGAAAASAHTSARTDAAPAASASGKGWC